MIVIQDKEFLYQEVTSLAELLSQLNYNKMYHHLVLVHLMYTHGVHHLVMFKDHLLPNQDFKLRDIVPMKSCHQFKVSVIQGLKNMLSNHPGLLNFVVGQATFHSHFCNVRGLYKSSSNWIKNWHLSGFKKSLIRYSETSRFFSCWASNF